MHAAPSMLTSRLFQAILLWAPQAFPSLCLCRLFQAFCVQLSQAFWASRGFSKPICKWCFSKHLCHASLGGLLLQVCIHCFSKGFIPTTSPIMAFLLSVDWICVQSPPLAFFDDCFAIIKNCTSPPLIGPIALAIDPHLLVADLFCKHLPQVVWDVELHVLPSQP